MKKSIVCRTICFILTMGMVLGYVNNVLKFKHEDGIYGLTTFYELEDNTVDVLFLGTSRAFAGFNTGTLWDEYGIASYVLAGSIQPLWNSYYYLKEALKTQTPEMIVLEGYMVTYWADYIDDSRIIKSNFGLQWSRDKIDSIKASAPKERWTEFLLEYTHYHTRYTELTAADFLKNKNDRLYDDWKGFSPYLGTGYFESVTDVHGVTERVALYEKSERYYRAIIELAQMNNIPIIIVISPYPSISERDQQMYNTADDIAAEYGIPFINCNLLCDKIGIDFLTDAVDTVHLNNKGTQKYSSFIGSYLIENYSISDHRGDASYKSWKRNAAYLTQIDKNQDLKETYDIAVIAEKLLDSNYLVFITVDGNCTTSDENLQSFFHTLGLPIDGSCGIWYLDSAGGTWYSQMEEAEQCIRAANHDFCMRRTVNDAGAYANAIIIDNVQYQKVSNGVNIVVYDTVTETISDTIGINLDDGYNVIR